MTSAELHQSAARKQFAASKLGNLGLEKPMVQLNLKLEGSASRYLELLNCGSPRRNFSPKRAVLQERVLDSAIKGPFTLRCKLEHITRAHYSEERSWLTEPQCVARELYGRFATENTEGTEALRLMH